MNYNPNNPLAYTGQAKEKENHVFRTKVNKKVVRIGPNNYLDTSRQVASVSNKMHHSVIYSGNDPTLITKQRINSLRILALLICNVRPAKDSHFATYVLHKHDLWSAIGARERPSNDEIISVMKNLVGITFTANEEDGWAVYPAMYYAKLQNDGTCLLQIHPEVAKFLLLSAPFNYRKWYLPSIYALKSRYSILLYMFLRRFVIKGKEVLDCPVTCQDLQDAMSVDDGIYRRHFSEFERHILVPSIEEINSKTELLVTISRIERKIITDKVMRKEDTQKRTTVRAIVFVIKENKKMLKTLLKQVTPKIPPSPSITSEPQDMYDVAT